MRNPGRCSLSAVPANRGYSTAFSAELRFSANNSREISDPLRENDYFHPGYSTAAINSFS